MRPLIFLCLAFLFWQSPAVANDSEVLPVPELSSPVTDQLNMLPYTQAETLRKKLTTFSQQTGSQIAVLIVPTTAPEEIDSYSLRVANSWQLGRKDVNDGLLIVLAIQDRRSRIEVGLGLEEKISNATAKQVLDDVMTPYFRQGDFADGLDAGTDRLISLISGKEQASPTKGQVNLSLIELLLGAGALVFAGDRLKRRFGLKNDSFSGGGGKFGGGGASGSW